MTDEPVHIGDVVGQHFQLVTPKTRKRVFMQNVCRTVLRALRAFVVNRLRIVYLRAFTSFTVLAMDAGVTHLRVFTVVTFAVPLPGTNGPSVETSAMLQGCAVVLHAIGVVACA